MRLLVTGLRETNEKKKTKNTKSNKKKNQNEWRLETGKKKTPRGGGFFFSFFLSKKTMSSGLNYSVDMGYYILLAPTVI